MTRGILRPICASIVTAAIFLSGARETAAQRQPPIEKFDGMAVDASPKPQNVGKIEIAIERWSKDGDGEKLGAAIAGGPEKLLDTLKTLGMPIGVIISPGIQASGARARERRSQSLLYARDIKTASGRQVVFATDEHLGFGELGKDRVRSEKNEFTIVDIRFGADGKGTGKIALVDHVGYNKQTRSIEIADYDKQPVGLVNMVATKR
jgi:hypothetical protein